MTGLSRIVMHWSAGTHTVSGLDREHYHFIIDGTGAVHAGKHKPEANISTKDGVYAAHTLGCNTGSIGVALAAMAGAVERPFNPGRYPITPAQVSALVRLCRDLAKQYKIPVTRQTVLSHAEVQPTLKIAQRGKWDISWLPGMTRPDDPVKVGDHLRGLILAGM
jgi:N-acetyl-anhydromuramyl-L-alanine amidase AmpD